MAPCLHRNFRTKVEKDNVPMTLELCNGIIILKAAAMLHDTDMKFAIIDSAHKAKSRHKYHGTFFKKYDTTRYQ